MNDNLSNTESIESALVKAQGSIKPLKKDGKNDYSRYLYATAENIINSSIEIFSSAGLAFDRKSHELFVFEGKLLLKSVFNLTHGPTKEIAEYFGVWPIIEKKGTPLDKAYAAALTSSLAYTIRDVLKIPRSDEVENMDRRDDTNHQPQQTQTQTQTQTGSLKLNQHPRFAEMLQAYEPHLEKIGLTKLTFSLLPQDKGLALLSQLKQIKDQHDKK
tara:strand:+ start:1267 stop:1914 length:648 start_codon:yes stop_codon:yes gene_type:complete